MSESTDTDAREQAMEQSRRDLMIAAGFAASGMFVLAFFVSEEHLWGVGLGVLIALANLSILARISAEMLSGNERIQIGGAIKVALKVLVLMGVVISVLFTRPHLAFGLCLGLALPAVAGVVLVFRNSARRASLTGELGANQTRD